MKLVFGNEILAHTNINMIAQVAYVNKNKMK